MNIAKRKASHIKKIATGNRDSTSAEKMLKRYLALYVFVFILHLDGAATAIDSVIFASGPLSNISKETDNHILATEPENQADEFEDLRTASASNDTDEGKNSTNSEPNHFGHISPANNTLRDTLGSNITERDEPTDVAFGDSILATKTLTDKLRSNTTVQETSTPAPTAIRIDDLHLTKPYNESSSVNGSATSPLNPSNGGIQGQLEKQSSPNNIDRNANTTEHSRNSSMNAESSRNKSNGNSSISMLSDEPISAKDINSTGAVKRTSDNKRSSPNINGSRSITNSTKTVLPRSSPTRTNLSAIDWIMQDKDLTFLGRNMKETNITGNEMYQKSGMTVFAPIDKVFLKLPMDINSLQFPNKTKYMIQISDYHVVAPKLIRPVMVKSDKPNVYPTRFQGKTVELTRRGPLDQDIRVNGKAKVVEVIETKKGFVYKIDWMLSPRWNAGPTVVDYIRSTPWLSKTRKLLEETGLSEMYSEVGPITIFLVPDSGWVAPNGVDIPECVFDALVKPENRKLLIELMSWITLPGLYNSTTLGQYDYLVNAFPPSLPVARVGTYHQDRRSLGDSTKDQQAVERLFTYIKGKQIVQWDMPLFNGYAHILSEMPFPPDLDINVALWECVHELCYECPRVVTVVLEYFDAGGLLPGDEPREFSVPPGPRPDWVCKGTEGWFPPGWKSDHWEDYLKVAKKGNSPSKAARLALDGSVQASQNLRDLTYDLEKAREKQARHEALQDWGAINAAVHTKKDPSQKIMGKLVRKQKPFPPDCKKEEDPARITRNDLRYITRWK